jgi:hypothetical protein
LSEKGSDKGQIIGYTLRSIVENWLFTIVIALVTISSLFLLRDWLWETFGVYGRVYVPTPGFMLYLHIGSAFGLIVLGLEHLIRHLPSKEKPLYPYKTWKDFGDFLHSGFYLIGLSQMEVPGNQGKYNGRQRITYLAFVYIAGLAAITGLLYLFGILGHSVGFVHVLFGGLTFMVVLFQFLIVIRNHDLIALKSTFITGKFPVWYVRKKRLLWYEKWKNENK